MIRGEAKGEAPKEECRLRREFPQHDLFNDPIIFAISEYVKFEAAVTAARDEDPHLVAEQRLRRATTPQSNDSSMRCMNSSMQHMERRMATLENVVTNVCRGAFTFTSGSREVQEPQPPLPAAAGPMPAPTAIESLEEQPPTHHLSCGTTMITNLWKEWTVGLEGQPSVEDLDERWGLPGCLGAVTFSGKKLLPRIFCRPR